MVLECTGADGTHAGVCWGSHGGVVRALLDAGAPINAWNGYSGTTALMLAVSRGGVSDQILMTLGVNMEPYIGVGHFECASLLLRSSARINYRDSKNQTAL